MTTEFMKLYILLILIKIFTPTFTNLESLLC